MKFLLKRSLQPFTIIDLERWAGSVKEEIVSLTWNRKVDWSSDNWRNRSACRDEDPSIFFPKENSTASSLQSNKAIQLCNQCDVRAECLNFALHANQETGIWGGMPEDERKKLRRQWLASRRRISASS